MTLPDALPVLIKERGAHGRQKRELADTYGALDPVALLKEVRQSVGRLCTLAER